MKKAALCDTASSALVLALTILFVRDPSAWPLYLFFLAACKGCAFIFLHLYLWRQYRPRLSIRGGIALLQNSAPLFGTSFCQLLCYNGGQLGLSYFLTASDMGIIGAVFKMVRALASLVNPFTFTLFPELCILRKDRANEARKVLRWSLLLTSMAACAASALCWALAPWLISLGLGPGYQAAPTVLRIALLAAPLMAANNVLANQMLTPYSLEKKQLAVQAAGALLALPLGALLGRLGLLYGASLPACLETALLAGFVFVVCKYGPQAIMRLK